MATWITPDGGDFLRDWAKGFARTSELMQDISGAAEEVLSFLEKAGEVASIVEQVLAANPLSAAFALLAQQLDSVIGDMRKSDVYVFPICPVGWTSMLRPYSFQHAMIDVQQSLSDGRDGSRPTADAQAPYAQITILVGADNWMDFQALLEAFGEFFSWDNLNVWSDLKKMRFRYRAHVRPPRPERNSQGNPWDWTRTGLTETVPVLHNLFDLVEALLSHLGGFANGIGDMVSQLARVLQKRLDKFQRLLTQLQYLAELITRWYELMPHMKVLYTAGNLGGVSKYAQDLQTSENPPAYKLVCGISLLATGVNPVNQFEKMMEFLGFKISQLQEQSAQVEQIVT